MKVELEVHFELGPFVMIPWCHICKWAPDHQPDRVECCPKCGNEDIESFPGRFQVRKSRTVRKLHHLFPAFFDQVRYRESVIGVEWKEDRT